ncbi:hypothetical protein ACIBSV_44235 [Embleya sp. NPDC050154]|uniref:hypothetical protein n=1 Tax=Embleya sp. NPDC050154 TaxID=3363988 RepID=UPI00379CFFB9
MTHPADRVDDHRTDSELRRLIGGADGSLTRVFTGIEHTAGYLAHTWDPPAGTGGPSVVLEGHWVRCIGRIGVLALRAATPAVRPERRERLLTFLASWADTVFADPEARLRIGRVRDGVGARDERGATVVVGPPYGLRLALELRAGDAEPPGLGTLEDAAEPARGWGTAQQLRRLVHLVRTRGPMPWDPAAVDELSLATGLSRPGAALILAGSPGDTGLTMRAADHERRVMALKVTECEVGLGELASLTAQAQLQLFANVLPDDPAALWEPTGPRDLAGRIAAAWQVAYGKHDPVPPETLTHVGGLGAKTAAADLCAAFARPADEPILSTDQDTPLRDSHNGAHIADRTRSFHIHNLIEDVANLLPVLYAELPAGDPVRSGIPAVITALRNRLEHPGVLLYASSKFDESVITMEALEQLFGKTPYHGPEPFQRPSIDDGLTVAFLNPPHKHSNWTPIPTAYFRPAHLGDDARSRILRRVDPASGGITAVDRIRSTYFDDIAKRVASDDLSPGQYEANPGACAPDLVARVADELGLHADAATLYLQLLVLESPTDAHTRRWNQWSPARHRKARAALADTDLVVQDKRTRAGRTLFLPGAWVGATTRKIPAMETWKARLLGVTLMPGGRVITSRPTVERTLPDLFAHAWSLTRSGEGPA